MKIVEIVGANIANRRRQLNISQKELAARLDTFIYDRRQFGPCCIDGCRIASRTASYYKTFYCFHNLLFFGKLQI